MLKSLLTLFLISISISSFSQCTGTEPVLFLGNDTTLCPGNTVTLTAPTGYDYYNWSDSSHLQFLNVSTTGTYAVEVGIVLNNIVVNGNFESGNTGFTTSYAPGTGGPYGTLSNPGEYAIATNPNSVHMYFSSCPDHTPTGIGRMMVVNGSGTPNSLVWSQTVAVTPNTDYQFGTWVMSVVSDPNVANLQFAINGVQLGGIFSTSPNSCIWEQFTNTWNSGAASSAVLSIYNQNSVNTGNDFALDDITFAPVCKKTDTINVTISTLPTHTTSLVGPSNCTGTPNGSITVNSPTGMEFSIDNGVTWVASNVFMNLAAGTYTVLSKNAAGCTTSSSETLVASAATPTHTTSIVQPTGCTAAADGEISINCSTAVSYSFDGGGSWQVSNTLVNLVAGTYVVMSQDGGGCTVSSSENLISSSAAPTQTTTEVSPTTCTGTPDGSITINCTTAVDYSFDGGASWQISSVLSNMAMGTYTVMSRNADGCTVSSTVTLTSSEVAPTQTLTVVSPSNCVGVPDGSISIDSPTGVQFSFDGGLTWQAGNSQTNLGAGSYDVISQNAGGCTVSSLVTLTDDAVYPSQSITLVSPQSCTGPPDGSILVNSTTGVLFSFDGGLNWQASSIQTGLDIGSYTVMTQNAAGCSVSSVETLTSALSYPIQTVSTIEPSSCSSLPDGSITINSSNGVQYSFDGGVSWQASNSMSGLPAGNYSVWSENAVGCSSSSSVTLTTSGGTPPTLALSSDVTVCENGSTTLVASASGGTSFIYHWNDFSSTGASQTVSPAATGYYSVYVENESACFSASDSILVTVLPALSALISPAVSVCPGQVGNLSVSSISGGMPPYSIAWSAGALLVGAGPNYAEAVTSNTTYSVGIMDACGSTPLLLSSAIQLSSVSVSPFTIDDDSQCEPAIFTISNPMDPSLIASSVWTISSGESYSDQSQITLIDYNPGSYDVRLIVTSTAGCVDTVEVISALTVYPSPVSSFVFDPVNIEMFNTTVDFSNQSSGAVDFLWRIDDGSPAVSSDVHVTSTFPDGIVGEYNVLLVAISDQQCVDSSVQIVTVHPAQLLFAPNTFTPNGDERNQSWQVVTAGFDFSNFDLSIFNRWGQLVWHSTDAEDSWDGSYKGVPVQDGMYSWALVTKDYVTDKKYYYKGNLSIMR
jgi:gliding motility-associated-like protein